MKIINFGVAVAALSIGSSFSASAATLDDVMAQLQAMQRDNQAIRRDNEAMRKEISVLRQRNVRAPAASTAEGPTTRSLPHNVSTAMAADVPASRGYYKAMPVESPYNWTGVYAGLNAGYAYGHDTRTELPFSLPAQKTTYEGFSGGCAAWL